MKENEERFIKELQHSIAGEIRMDAATRCAYSVDASIYEVEPLVVVCPKDTQDILTALAIAHRHRIPVTARGAATGITGGCLGGGLIFDLSIHMHAITEINIEKQYVVCQPGVIQDQLNAALAPHGYRLGPDTSTGNRATLGGMLANNAAGAHSLVFGKMVDHVLEVEIATAEGTLLNLEEKNEEQLRVASGSTTRLGRLYRDVDAVRQAYLKDILEKFPRLPRRASGYNLDELIKPGPLNLAKLIAGSEGTLGVITSMKMAISPKLKATGLCIIHLLDMIEGMKAIPQMLAFHPISLEMIDSRILETAKRSPIISKKLNWLEGTPQAIFVAEFEAPDLTEKLAAFQKEMELHAVGYAFKILTLPEEMQQVWDVRKAGLGLLLSKRAYSRAIAFIEDLSVPPEHLADFMSAFRKCLVKHQKEAGIYGHVGAGCMHIRPYIDLRHPEELKTMHAIMLEVSALLIQHGGALSGEHGDGLVRTWLNEKMFGPQIYAAFRAIKKAFDPDNSLNPGKIVEGPPLLQNLRLSPDTNIQPIETFQDFSPEGGFALAADLCNGNAQCRKGEGLMCPSFQASGDEFDTTRARAQALRAVINGRWKISDFASAKVGEVMDLCLECKGCKTECPSGIDMAKMKAEFLYHYQEKHGYLLRNRLFGHIASLYSIAQPMARFVNALGDTSLAKYLMEALGISSKRRLPPLAQKRFSASLHSYSTTENKRVVLFNDTFTEFNQPQVGHAAHYILSLLGFEVIIPPWACCGRPLISKGLLEQARSKATRLIDTLYPYASKGLAIVGLEPSCILTVADDLPTLVSSKDRMRALLVAKKCLTFDQFLHAQIIEGKLPLPFAHAQLSAKVHGHCHQKALVGMKPTMEILQAIPRLTASEIPSGCCGMAGSFGYEKEHYSMSMKIGSLHLFPPIIDSPFDERLIANGFSCRNQIEHGTGRKAMHLAEFIAHLCWDLK